MTAFISYQRKSSATLANLVCKGLSEHGINSFLDTINMDMCGPFPDYLRLEIDKASVFVCLLGSSTLDSEWVLEEIKYAHEKKRAAIPVFQEGFVATEKSYPDYVVKLLQNTGIKLLDETGIYIPEAINHLAVMIKKAAKELNISDLEMSKYEHYKEAPPRYGQCHYCGQMKFVPETTYPGREPGREGSITTPCLSCGARVYVRDYIIEVSGTNPADVKEVIHSLIERLEDKITSCR
jgi:hypothetical protein